MKNRVIELVINDENYCGDGETICSVGFEGCNKVIKYLWDGFGADKDPRVGDKVLVNGLSHIGEVGTVVAIETGYFSDYSNFFQITKIL